MRAARRGSLLILAVDVLMLSSGHLSLWQQMGTLGSFFDAQGRALLHGHLYVPPSSASIEGFLVGGHTYLYFGLFPTLLRLPILLVTHSLDGRLTQLSMLLALIVLLAAAARVHWRLRELIRPRRPLGGTERRVVFLMPLALGGGVPLFLASWPVVYHEAELWGAALTLAALDVALGIIVAPSGRRIALCGALCVLAINARASVGLGPIIALALFAVGVGARWAAEASEATGRSPRISRAARTLAALGPDTPGRSRRTFAFLTIAVVVAFGSSLAINDAKFGTPIGLPLLKQVNTRIDPTQRAAVLSNHGSLFGLKFVPTTLLATIRPDAVGAARGFPFIGLPRSRPPVVGSAKFIARLPSLSASTSMPLLCLLIIAGIPLLARRRAGPVTSVLAGAALGFAPTLAVSSVATRYLADLLPFLWIAACSSLHCLLASPGMRIRVATPARRRGALAAVVLALLIGVAVNGGAGLLEENLLAPTTSAGQRAGFVRFQDEVDRLLGRKPHDLSAGAVLPSDFANRAPGDLFVLGRCAGLYVDGDGVWLPVERGDQSGLHKLALRWPVPLGRHPEALATLGSGSRRVTAVLTPAGPRAALSLQIDGRTAASGPRMRLAAGGTAELTLRADRIGTASVVYASLSGAGSQILTLAPFDPSDVVLAGADPFDRSLASFGGSAIKVPQNTPLCHRLARRAGVL